MRKRLNKILHKFIVFQLKLVNKQSRINLITYIILGMMTEENKTECKVICETKQAQLKGKFKLKIHQDEQKQ